jgi:DNA-binding CsgD family transcriptional regulator/HD-like signal output (HDOD) protein
MSTPRPILPEPRGVPAAYVPIAGVRPVAEAGAAEAGGPAVRGVAGNRLALAFRALEAFPALRESRDGLAAALVAPTEDRSAIVAGIVSDVGLAIPVLREAARVGGPDAAVSVAAAVECLDPDALGAICAAVPGYDVLAPPGRWHRAPYRYLRHAVATQRAVRRLVAVLGRSDGDVLVTAALLRDVGRLALAHAEGRPGQPFADRGGADAPADGQESAVDAAALRNTLLQRWGLPAALRGSGPPRNGEDPGQAAAILRLADLVARHDHAEGVSRDGLLTAARAAGLTDEHLRSLLYEQAGIVVVPHGGLPCPLTPSELEALRGLSRGLRYKEIAAELGVQASTIGSHLHKVYAKTGTTDRAQAVLLAMERGWLDT